MCRGIVIGDRDLAAALVEAICYRVGVRRPTDSDSVSAIAAKYGVQHQRLRRQISNAIRAIPDAVRLADQDDRILGDAT
jgi:hypothetical protein